MKLYNLFIQTVFTTGAILFASIDYNGIQDYAIKATIGGVILLGFKLLGDYLSYKMLKKVKGKDIDTGSAEPDL